MGFHDREYYRGDEGGGFRLFGGLPTLRGLIIFCVAVFVLQAVFTDAGKGIQTFGLAATAEDALARGWVWQLFTAPFLHQTPLSLAFALLCLYFMGRATEQLLGSRELMALVAMFGVAGTLSQVVYNAAIGAWGVPFLGMFGVVSGLFAVFAIREPGMTVLLFFFIPMKMIVGFWLFLGLSVAAIVFPQSGFGATGAMASVSCLLLGAAYSKYRWRLTGSSWEGESLAEKLAGWMPKRRRGPRLYRPRGGEGSVVGGGGGAGRRASGGLFGGSGFSESRGSSVGGSGYDRDSDPGFEEELDAVLAKIAREGRESLTAGERAILEKASERAKRRRANPNQRR